MSANCPQCDARRQSYRVPACQDCGYRYCFGPRDARQGLTDSALLTWIERASNGRSYSFTEQQLYSAYRQALQPGRPVFTFVGSIFVFVGLVILLQGVWPVGIVIGMVGLAALACSKPQSPLDQEQFQHALTRWRQAGQELPGLLEPDAVTPANNEPAAVTVRHILLVPQPLLASQLIQNRLDTSGATWILSATGPQSEQARRVARWLRQHPQTRVYWLHDSPSDVSESLEVEFRQAWQRALGESGISPPKDWVDLGLTATDQRHLRDLIWPGQDFGTPVLQVAELPYGVLNLLLQNALEDDRTIGELLSRMPQPESSRRDF